MLVALFAPAVAHPQTKHLARLNRGQLLTEVRAENPSIDFEDGIAHRQTGALGLARRDRAALTTGGWLGILNSPRIRKSGDRSWRAAPDAALHGRKKSSQGISSVPAT